MISTKNCESLRFFSDLVFSLIRRGFRKLQASLSHWRQRHCDTVRGTVLSDRAFHTILRHGKEGRSKRFLDSGLLEGLHRLVDRKKLEEFTKDLPSSLGENWLGRLTHLSDQFRAHQFDLLGSGPVTVDYCTKATGFMGHRYSMSLGKEAERHQLSRMLGTLREASSFTGDTSPALRALCDSLSPEIGEGMYRAIDWHLDFKSGYRWDPKTWYMNIPYGHQPGVDIKIPWELSRFQHLPLLALEGLIRAGTDGNAKEVGLQILDWIVANPSRFGVNWRSAMDVAIRAANWIWALALLPRQSLPFTLQWIIAKSLYQHVKHVETHLDYAPELTGNHYLAEIVGLMHVAFSCPEFPESSRWLGFCLQELVSEMKRTVYCDGVNHEGSTGYHRLVTEMFLHGSLLALRLSTETRKRIAGCRVEEHRVAPRLRPVGIREFSLEEEQIFPEWYWRRLHDMVGYIADLTKPNGLVPQWGDQDSGRFVKFSPVLRCKGIGEDLVEEHRDHRHLLAVGGAMFERMDWLQAGLCHQGDVHILTSNISGLPLALSGGRSEGIGGCEGEIHESTPHSRRTVKYSRGGSYILQRSPFWLAVNCHSAGKGGRRTHEHNDCLSFELNVAGRDIVVDWGTGVYTADPEMRNAFRATVSHSTVAVEGMEQNPFLPGLKGLFTLPEHSHAQCLECEAGRFVGQHSGFGSVHRRIITLQEDGVLIEDMLEMVQRSFTILTLAPTVVSRFDPDNNSVLLSHGPLKLAVEVLPSARAIHIVQGFCSEGYGMLSRSHKIMVERVCPNDSLRILLIAKGET